MRGTNLLGSKTKWILGLTLLLSALFIAFLILSPRLSKETASALVGNKAPSAEIHIIPADGEVVENLSQPLFIFFEKPVTTAHFSFSVDPDPGGWKTVWDDDRRRVKLVHDAPFVPLTQYRVKASVKDGPSLESGFKIAEADPNALLESDTTRGVITIDQAAIYRVLRLFKPRAVPEKYRYRARVDSGAWDMMQVTRQWKRLRPETIRELRPYFTRPDHPASAFHKRIYEPGLVRLTSLLSPVLTADAAEPEVKEVYQTETGYYVAIIGTPATARLVSKARQLVERHKMYERFERMLHRRTYDYGDHTLYVYIDPYLEELEGEGESGSFEPAGICVPAEPDPDGSNPNRRNTWIEISARQISDDPHLAAVLAHEMFHAFQYAFSDSEQKWLVEGSAKWAEDFIGHDWNTEQYYLNQVFNQLGSGHYRITEKFLPRSRGIYLFFYYLTRVRSGGGDFTMRQIWENCEVAPGDTLKSVKAGIGGDFKEVMKEYALFTLDKEQCEGKFPDAVGQYSGENPLKLAARHKFRQDWRIKKDKIDWTAVAVEPMAIRYVEVINEVSGLEAPTIRFDLQDFKKRDSIAVQAIIKYRDGDSAMEDWTGRDERVFCLALKRDDFSSIYLAVSDAEDSEEADGYALNIAQVRDFDCLGGQMEITMSIQGVEESRFTKRFYYDNRDHDVISRWNREARFYLDLVPSRPETVEEIVSALPEQIRENARGGMQQPESFFDENTRCQVHVFQVKSCRVGSFTRSLNRSGTETQTDASGLAYEARRTYSESWSSRGLSKKTQKWLQEKSLNIRVYVDPETRIIKWVTKAGPIGVRGEGKASLKIEGRKRVGHPPETSYEDVSRSDSEDLKEDIMVGHVSDDDAKLPMNPDWQARPGGRYRASGEGESKRSLDREITGDDGEKTVIRGQETIRIKWKLSVELNPQ